MSSQLVSIWVQRADFSTTEHETSSAAEAVSRYRDHEWASELALENELAAGAKEHCPPGMGFVGSDGHILHVCPRESDASINFHCPVKRKLLGFIPVSSKEVLFVDAFPPQDVAALIEAFVAGLYSEVRTRLEAAS